MSYGCYTASIHLTNSEPLLSDAWDAYCLITILGAPQLSIQFFNVLNKQIGREQRFDFAGLRIVATSSVCYPLTEALLPMNTSLTPVRHGSQSDIPLNLFVKYVASKSFHATSIAICCTMQLFLH